MVQVTPASSLAAAARCVRGPCTYLPCTSWACCTRALHSTRACQCNTRILPRSTTQYCSHPPSSAPPQHVPKDIACTLSFEALHTVQQEHDRTIAHNLHRHVTGSSLDRPRPLRSTRRTAYYCKNDGRQGPIHTNPGPDPDASTAAQNHGLPRLRSSPLRLTDSCYTYTATTLDELSRLCPPNTINPAGSAR